MSKRFLAALLAAIATQAGAATWNVFTADPGGPEDAVTFFDADSVTRSGDSVTMQFESLRDVEKNPDETMYRQVSRITFHCGARTFDRTAPDAFAWDGTKAPAFGNDAIQAARVNRYTYEERWMTAACAATFPVPQPGGRFVRVPDNDRKAWALRYYQQARAAFWSHAYGPPTDPPPARIDCAGSRFRFAATVQDLPPEVLQQLRRAGAMSDHGGPFNAGDVIVDDTPQRRFAGAAVADQRVFAEVEHGGIGYNIEVWAFERQDGHWNGRPRWYGFHQPASVADVLQTTCRQNAPPAREGRPAQPQIACGVDRDRSISLSYSDADAAFNYVLDRKAVARGIARQGRIVAGMTGNGEPSPAQVEVIRERLESARASPGNRCPAYAFDEFMRALGGHDEPPASPGAGRSARPSPASALLRDAQSAEMRGDAAAQRALLDRACALDPGNAQAFAMRARLLQHSDERRALADYDTALRLDPAQPEVRFARARVQLQHAAPGPERAAAVRELAIVDTQLPPDADLRESMASLYAALGMPGRELAQWDLWIATHAAQGVHFDDRCWARVRLHADLQLAVDDCTRAAQLDRNAPAPLEHRGWAHLRLGEPEQALADFDRALQLGGRNDWARYGRALAHQQRGQAALARADFAGARLQDHDIDAQVADAGLAPTPAGKPVDAAGR
jgi:tetratricopeptide (TPR) repeat protein